MLESLYRYWIAEPSAWARDHPGWAALSMAATLLFAVLQAATGGHALAALAFIALGIGVLLRMASLLWALIRCSLFTR